MDKYLGRIKEANRGRCAVEHFDPSAERIGAFLSRAMTGSLFSETRALCILRAQTLSEADLKALDGSLDYELPDVYMFISAEIESKGGKPDAKGGKIAKALQLKKRGSDKSTSIQSFAKPPDYKLAEWIAAQVPELFGRQIGKAEAEYLAETVEYDLIYSELQKIDMALPPGARVDRKTIEDIVGTTRTMTVYELAAALGKKDLPAALRVLDSLMTNDLYAPLLASALFKHFWSLLKIRKYLEKNPQALRQYNTRGYGKDSPQTAAAFEIGSACGLVKSANMVYPVMIKSGVVNQAQSFSARALANILDTLQKFDVGIKTGRADDDPCALQMLCYKIARAS
jgi:DNA polymerase III delta subunit